MVHAATFSIYVMSIIIGELTFLLWNFNKYIFKTLVLMKFCSAITQVRICYIFWNMDNIQFVPLPATLETNEEEVTSEEAIEEVRVERIDSDFDLQLRMWQQFMRVAPSSVY